MLTDEKPRLAGYTHSHQGLAIDREAREVLRDNEQLALTRTEFDLLALLMDNPRRVLSPRQILTALWDTPHITDDDCVEVYISRLRRKLGESASQPHYIRTVRGVGYRFEPDRSHATEPTTALFDDSGVLQLLTPATSEILGWPVQEVIGTRFIPSLNPLLSSAAFISLANRIVERAGLTSFTLNTDVQDRFGSKRSVHVDARFIMQEGRVHGLLVTYAWLD